MEPGLYGVFYQFLHKGEKYSISEVELVCCYPSIAGDGSYFFMLKDGAFFRGEQVEEVVRKETSPLIKYQQISYR
ncbi:TPA: hypothetical protein ACTXE4_001724 [Raoultella ornithinolytica]